MTEPAIPEPAAPGPAAAGPAGADVLRTPFTDRYRLRVPVVCAPMAGVAGGRLAAAVSAAGGLGMIGVGSAVPAEQITSEAAVARAAGQQYGIGLMAWAQQDDPGQLAAAIAAAPVLVSVSYGDYRRCLEPLHAAGIPMATQVGTVAEAVAAAAAGVDVLVARGAEAGGHGLCAVGTLPLLQAVLDAVPDLPVLAAGGIVTGRGLAAVLAAGAAGAWVGTGFLACPEASNTRAARARICAAAADETVHTRVFDIALGNSWPPQYGGRALANEFTARWHGAEPALAADPTATTELTTARSQEDYRIANLYAGQGVGSVTMQRPAAEVVHGLAEQATRLLSRPAARPAIP